MPIEEQLDQDRTPSEQPNAEKKPRDKYDTLILIVVMAVTFIFLCTFVYTAIGLRP